MTASELYSQTLAVLFPDSPPENLLGVDAGGLPSTAIISNGILPGFFQQALYDLQTVPCYRYNHHAKYPHCASYFNCGMTVIPKPQGKITEIYTTDRVNPETGLEDVTADDEHCAKVYYEFVEHCFMSRYVKLCQQSSSTSDAVMDVLANLLFGAYRSKSRYPRPTDEGLTALPTLPDGFHYPQASTDAAGRSPRGVFSFSGNQIWIAPWIQSTETLHIKWNGIQRKFGETDAVEDDPKFAQAVRLHMGQQYHSCYGDSTKADDFKDQLWGNRNRGIVGAIPTLMDECAEEMLAARCGATGPGSMSGGAARGLGAQETAYYNDTQFEYTAYCPTGKTGGPFRVVKEIGSVPSAFSISDANARASQQAQDEANAKLSLCVTTVVVYWNTAQPGSASCPGASADGLTPAATGPSVTFTEPANMHSSPDNVEAANALAKAAAEATAQSMLTCTFHNRAQTRTAVCPTGTVGDEQEATIPANEYHSTINQADADSMAGIAAQNAAEALLACGTDTFLVYNSTRTAQANGICRICSGTRVPGGGGGTDCRQQPITAVGTVPAGTLTGLATTATAGTVIGQLNAQAQALAQQRAQAALPQICSGMGGSLV